MPRCAHVADTGISDGASSQICSVCQIAHNQLSALRTCFTVSLTLQCSHSHPDPDSLARTANAHKPTANANARSHIHSLCSSSLSGGQVQEGGHPSVRELLSSVDSWRACHDSAVDTCWPPHRQLLYRQRCANVPFFAFFLSFVFRL